MKYASNNIRNILIAGHAGSGKTTLTEALVYFSGAAERMGRVEDGTTISDFDPEEAKRKASLSASVVPVEYEGIKYNLIDAPGLFDFEAGEYEGIRAAESVLVCVSGRSGVTVGAEKAFQLARKNGKATMVFISKCDLENANYFKILEDMKIKFGSTVCPCVVPAKLDDGTPVYINLFSQKAFKYESGKQIQVDLPDIGHRFQGLIEAMSEAIAETDDELMEKFFGGEPFTTEEIVEGMRKGVKDGLITPVFCGSAVNLQALDMLLAILQVDKNNENALSALAQFYADKEDGDALNKLIAQYQAMIEKSGTQCYIIIGDTDNPTEAYDSEQYESDIEVGTKDNVWETALREAFGEHFINMRAFMIEHGLETVGLEPTEQDLDDLANGRVPEQLKDDYTHFNSYGYYAMGAAVYQKGVELGYW